jgi:hypothetical protein
MSKPITTGRVIQASLMLAVIVGLWTYILQPSKKTTPVDPPAAQAVEQPAPAPASPEVMVQEQEIAKFHTLIRADARVVNVCAQAGMVKAAFLQSNDVLNVEKWDKIEQALCDSRYMDYDKPISQMDSVIMPDIWSAIH